MKTLHFFLFVGVFLLALVARGQVRFTKSMYTTSDNIEVTVTPQVIGVENGIRRLSEKIPAGTTSVNLGRASEPGVYLLNFALADNSRRSYLVGVSSPPAVVPTSVMELGTGITLTTEQRNVFRQVFKFFSESKPADRFKPFTAGAQNFCVNNGVSVVKNVTFCLAAANTDFTVPILNTLCADMSLDNLKSLTLEVYKELFRQMREKNYLTKEQYDRLNVDTYIALAKLLDRDCSAFFDLIASRIDNPGLKMAISYQGQLCSSTVSVIKLYKKIP